MGKQQFNRSLSKDEIQTANKKMKYVQHSQASGEAKSELHGGSLVLQSEYLWPRRHTTGGAGGNVGAKGTLDTVEIT